MVLRDSATLPGPIDYNAVPSESEATKVLGGELVEANEGSGSRWGSGSLALAEDVANYEGRVGDGSGSGGGRSGDGRWVHEALLGNQEEKERDG